MGPVEVLWYGDRVPTSRKDLGPVEVLWDGDWVTPTPLGGGQSENITSRRTMYSGGKNLENNGGFGIKLNALKNTLDSYEAFTV